MICGYFLFGVSGMKKEIEVVRPEILARWRQWGLQEEIIMRNIAQRQRTTKMREVEEWITIADFAYQMPHLPEIEAQKWGFVKAIDFEGHISPEATVRQDKIAKKDRWFYRREYHTPRVVISTRDYEIIEEIAHMMHVFVRIIRSYVSVLKRHIIMYRAETEGSRAVMIC